VAAEWGRFASVHSRSSKFKVWKRRLSTAQASDYRNSDAVGWDKDAQHPPAHHPSRQCHGGPALASSLSTLQLNLKLVFSSPSFPCVRPIKIHCRGSAANRAARVLAESIMKNVCGHLGRCRERGWSFDRDRAKPVPFAACIASSISRFPTAE